MSRALVYLDTSAFVKVPLGEPEADALVAALGGRPLVASRLLDVEARRVAARLGPDDVAAVEHELSAISLVPLDDEVLTRAAGLKPSGLGTLDALHLATAVSIDAVAAIATYDRALAAAARDAGLDVVAPGS